MTPSRPRANAAVCPAGARELHNASARRARVSAPSAHGIGLRHARARRSRYRQHATEKHDTLNAERLATAQSANCCDVQNCAERETLVKDWESRIDAACRRTASPASLETAPCPPKHSPAQSESCRALRNCAEREINVIDREGSIGAACLGASPPSFSPPGRLWIQTAQELPLLGGYPCVAARPALPMIRDRG